jgi:ATP/ADP translocase
VLRSKLDALLESVLKIRRGEFELVALMFVYLMGIVSAFVVGRTVRDTLFLSRYDVSSLPMMYVAVAIGVSVSSYAYARIADRYRRDRVVPHSLLGFTALMAIFYVIAGTGAHWIYPALYVGIEVVGAITILQFWTFASDIFSARVLASMNSGRFANFCARSRSVGSGSRL